MVENEYKSMKQTAFLRCFLTHKRVFSRLNS